MMKSVMALISDKNFVSGLDSLKTFTRVILGIKEEASYSYTDGLTLMPNLNGLAYCVTTPCLDDWL